MTTCTRPAKTHTRSIGWVSRLDFALGTIRVVVDGVEDRYYLSPAGDASGAITCRKLTCEPGKAPGKYRVSLTDEGGHCTCPAMKFRGACRHLSGLRALAAAGNL